MIGVAAPTSCPASRATATSRSTPRTWCGSRRPTCPARCRRPRRAWTSKPRSAARSSRSRRMPSASGGSGRPPAGSAPDAGTAERVEVEAAAGHGSAPTLAEGFVDRLAGAGPAARQVWLPPLAESPSLDALLPACCPTRCAACPCRPRASVADYTCRWASSTGPTSRFASCSWPTCPGRRPRGRRGRPADGQVDAAAHPRAVAGTDAHAGGGPVLRARLRRRRDHVGQRACRTSARWPPAWTATVSCGRWRSSCTSLEIARLLRRTRASSRWPPTARVPRAGQIDDPYGDVFLVDRRLGQRRQDYQDLESGSARLASRGLSFGLHVVIGATRWSEIRPRLRDLLGPRSSCASATRWSPRWAAARRPRCRNCPAGG